jgi:hypothetical protein
VLRFPEHQFTDLASCPLDRSAFASLMQRSEQYFTSAQFFAHALRQTILRQQCVHGFSGRLLFVIFRIDVFWILYVGSERDIIFVPEQNDFR